MSSLSRVLVLGCALAFTVGLSGCSAGVSAPTTATAVAASGESSAAGTAPVKALLVYQWTGPSGKDSVTLAASDGRAPRAMLPEGVTQGFHPDWSHDGSKVVFADQATGLWVMAPDGSGATRVHDCVNCDYPAWSPDGASILFTQYADGGGPPRASSLTVLDLKSGILRTVVEESSPRLADVPRWSPDGKQIVYGIDRFDASGAETGSAIAIVAASGGQPRVLTDYKDYAYYPDWSPDGATIVFDVETVQFASKKPDWADTWDLWTIAPGGSHAHRLTRVGRGVHLWQPSWAPVGTAIYATLDSPSGRQGVRVALDGAIGPGLTGATHVRLQPTG